MARFGDLDTQYFDDAGDPLAYGRVYFYESGTTTPKTTYADVNNSIPNANPVLLTAAGRQPNIFFDGVARAILTNSSDVQIAVRDPVGETATDFGDQWVATKVYSSTDVVLGSDGIYYRSLINGNQNNNPVTTSGYWTLLYSVEWNAGITYDIGAVVTYNNQQYQSLQSSNVGNNPSSATSYWVPLNFAWMASATYAINQNVVGTDGILYTSLQNANTGNDPASSPAWWVGTSAAAAASATAAAASATAAAASETAAAASETAASASETNAAQSATDAATSETNAAQSATDASTSATNAATSETNAATSETAAAGSATAAASSATAAASSASAASTSETNAAASETAAAASETAAAASESAAATSATNAANSATASATSASDSATSATASAGSATSAASSATAAAGSATSAASSATAAATSASDAAAKYDEFDDRYLGEKASDPSVDNDGNPLVTGALYFNTTDNKMKVYSGSAWVDVAPVATSVTLSQVTDFPSQSGNSGKYLTTNGTTPSWAALSTDPTLATQTKTYTSGEISTLTLSSAVTSGVPVVSVTKEVPQTGVTNNDWDASASSYTLEDSAYATTLDFDFNVSGAYFVDSFSVSSQETSSQDMAFNSDGTKMFVVGLDGQDVNEYLLSSAFDVSTASYSQSFSVSTQETSPRGITFNTDGTKMYIVGTAGVDVNEYTLSTGFDVSTSSYSQNFSVSAQETAPYGIAFNTDGTKMFIVGATGDDVNEYTLSTGFDISTATYSQNFSVSAQDGAPQGIAFNSDGTKMFIVGSGQDYVYQYTLSTGFDVSTATYNQNFSVYSQEILPTGIAFSTDGTKMFVVGSNGDNVNEYTITPNLSLGTGSFASADVGKTIEANSGVFVLTSTAGAVSQTTAPTSYAQVASGSWSMYGVVYDSSNDYLKLSGIVTGQFDISTASYSRNFSVSAQITSAQNIAFNTDGTKMFVVDYSGQDVNEYTLATGFDLSTATYSQNFSVSSQETAPIGIAFNTDGTKMFIVGATGDDVNEYTLSTGFDISTASYSQNFSVSSQDTSPAGIAFNTDGTKMFVIGGSGVDVNQYTLSTGFDVSTATYLQNFSVSTEEASPIGIAFNTDGTKMFIVGVSGDDVNQYTLSTAFDVSTATYSQNFSVSAQDTAPRGIAFNNDGSKMFIVGNTGADINEYDITLNNYIPSQYQPAISANIDTTYWTDINSLTATDSVNDGAVYYAISDDSRTTWSVQNSSGTVRDIVRNNAGTWEYNSNGTFGSETWTSASTNSEVAALREAMEGAESLNSAYDVSTASFVDSFSVSAQESDPCGLSFNTDGTKMFVVGVSGDDVNEYTLSTGFDVSTATFVDSFSVSAQASQPRGVAFNTDGTKMYVISDTTGARFVYQYTLSTGFDVSSASYASLSFNVGGQDTSPQDLSFSSDGSKMFVVGDTNNSVYEYSLSTAFDVSTASYTRLYSVASQDTSPRGLVFNSDGTKMFFVGFQNADVYEYDLSTAFDLSSVSYVGNFSISSQESNPQAIAWNSNGSKMFVVGLSGVDVNEYTVGTTTYTNQMTSTTLNALTDAQQITLTNDLDFAAIFYLASGSTVPTYSGTAINYDANTLNEGAVLGTDYDFDFPATDKVRITSLGNNNLKVRVV